MEDDKWYSVKIGVNTIWGWGKNLKVELPLMADFTKKTNDILIWGDFKKENNDIR